MPRKPSEIEEKVWEAATHDVKPLKKKRRVVKPLTPEQLAKKPIKPKPSFVLKAATNARAFDAKIDLHGHSESSAHAALMHWMATQVKRGARRLLVITGKGSGAIKTGVPRWLDVAPFDKTISSIEPAPLNLGGDGAFLVKLKKAKVAT